MQVLEKGWFGTHDTSGWGNIEDKDTRTPLQRRMESQYYREIYEEIMEDSLDSKIYFSLFSKKPEPKKRRKREMEERKKMTYKEKAKLIRDFITGERKVPAPVEIRPSLEENHFVGPGVAFFPESDSETCIIKLFDKEKGIE